MAFSTLFVIIDPTTDDQLALVRAEQIAVDTNAKIHLFCCDYLDDIGEYASRKDAKQSVLDECKEYLEELAEPLRHEGLAVTTEACWNSDWQTSAIRASARMGADLILKSTSLHSQLERRFTRTSDITLLRQAPCPLLLVTEPDPWESQRLLAALAIEHEDNLHDQLNNAIISHARRLAAATLSELHCVIALEQKPDLSEVLNLLAEDREFLSEAEHIGELVGIPAHQVHIRPGSAKHVIVEVAEELRVDAVVLGTAARKGIKAMLLGNTAEKVLDLLECDLLVVN